MNKITQKFLAARSAWKRAGQPVMPRISMGRSYEAAQVSRLTEDWKAPNTTSDAELYPVLKLIRNRMRELERNDPYARRYLSALENNIFDHHGISVEVKSGDFVKRKNEFVFELDRYANSVILEAWKEWCDHPFVGNDSKTLNDGSRLALRRTAVDGESVTKFHRGPVNRFGFGLQLLESDIIDEDMNRPHEANQVRLGVEVDKSQQPVAYWLRTSHPGDFWWNNGYRSERHEAFTNGMRNFVHLFRPDRPTAVRGVSWLAGVGLSMKMLDSFDEAALMNARVGAAKMGFFTRTLPEGGSYAGPKDSEGNIQMDADPGSFEELPVGMQVQSWDPAYPSDAYAPFVKAQIRRIASGLNMNYNLLSSDLEGVNFSSIRAGVLEEREFYKVIQTWFVSQFMKPIFSAWLEMALATGAIPLPFSKFAKFNKPVFRPRRWPWVDPLKDMTADKLAIDSLLDSRTNVIAENTSRSIDEIISEQRDEAKKIANAGLSQAGSQAVNVTVTTGDGTTEDNSEENAKAKGKAAAAENVQQAALNGAQVDSLMTMLQAVASGQIPAETAKAAIAAAFPLMTSEQIDQMMAPLKNFTQKKEESNNENSEAKV